MCTSGASALITQKGKDNGFKASLGGYGVAHEEFTELSNSGDYIWTSTENDESSAWSVRFSSGDESWQWKDNTFRRVRPIRRIPV